MKPSSARCAVAARVEPASAGGTPSTIDAAVALQAADAGIEEALQLDQLGRVGDPGGVEDQRLGLALGAGPFDPDPVEGRLQRPLEAGAGRGSAEHGAGEDRGALAVALELHRPRQAELPATSGRGRGR